MCFLRKNIITWSSKRYKQVRTFDFLWDNNDDDFVSLAPIQLFESPITKHKLNLLVWCSCFCYDEYSLPLTLRVPNYSAQCQPGISGHTCSSCSASNFSTFLLYVLHMLLALYFHFGWFDCNLLYVLLVLHLNFGCSACNFSTTVLLLVLYFLCCSSAHPALPATSVLFFCTTIPFQHKPTPDLHGSQALL